MDKQKILEILTNGEIELVGQFNWGSNYTFLVTLKSGTEQIEAVYKPSRGERPLWDFPSETLAGREVAAYLVSEALGWDFVPPTVLRAEGPYGPGSMQMRVQHDPEQHYFTFDKATLQGLRAVALFDLVINNADRKGGHLLLDPTGKIWLIDHGISFHAEPKLRTVIWDFVGEAIPAELLAGLQDLSAQLRKRTGLRVELSKYLDKDELAALGRRIKALLEDPRFPAPPEDERAVPWPLV